MTDWNKVYRGGVQRTTPETMEVNRPATGVLLPGTCVAVTASTNTATKTVGDSSFFYFVGEQLHGSIDDDQGVASVALDGGSSVRLYSPRSGDLYVGRAAAGVAFVNDLPLAINADGRLVAAGAEDIVRCYADNPKSAHPQTLPSTTVLDQLIPVKIK